MVIKVKLAIGIKYDYGSSCMLSFIITPESAFGNKGKLVALLVFSSFGRVTISVLWRMFVFTGIGSQITPSCRIHFSITTPLSSWNDYDVTRQVATEHGRNKYSHLEFFFLCLTVTLLRSFNKLHSLN